MRKLILNVCALVFTLLACGASGAGVVYASSPFQDPPPPPVAPEVLLPLLATAGAFLLSAAGAAMLSDKLRAVTWFSNLSSLAKFVIVGVLCSAIGILVHEGRAWLVSMPAVVSKIDEWLRIVMPVWTWVYSQIRYGGTTPSQAPGTAPAADARFPTYGGG